MKFLARVLSIVGAISLAIALVAAGFAACTTPLTTKVLSQQFSNSTDSVYTHDDLVQLACATRDFSIDPYPTSRAEAELVLDTAIEQAAAHSARDANTAQLWEGIDTTTRTTDERFTLDTNARNHLADCNALIRTAEPILIGSAILALACTLLLLLIRARRELSGMLIGGGLGVLCAFVIFGAAAAINFNAFFSAFHSVFFPQGNWMFSVKSLLICMYPQAFWMAMGGLWLAVTVLGAIMCIVAGRRGMRTAGKHVRK